MQWVLAVITLLATGCTATDRPVCPPVERDRAASVFVVHHGWHTGIAFARPELEAVFTAEELDQLPHGDFLEFGWGEEEYYQAEAPTTAMLLKAAWGGAAVLHVRGLALDPAAAFPANEVVRLALGREGARQSLARVRHSFSRAGGKLLRTGGRAAGNAAFFHSGEPYSATYNCNTWAAAVLAAGGLNLSTSIMTAEGVLEAIQECR